MMLRNIFLIVCLLGISFSAFAGELLLTGVYRGSNLYIQNPHDGHGNYCITAIYINNEKLAKVPAATAFNLDLSFLKENDPVVIKIFHNDNCRPKVLNPNAIRSKTDFQFTGVNLNNDNITWATKGEKKFGKYFVMKYEHNSWIMEQVLDAKGVGAEADYSFPTRHHTGLNRYKIQYLDVNGKIYYSDVVEFTSTSEKVTFYPKRVSKSINFSKEVKYEILDAYGKVVKRGFGIEVDCSDLSAGAYYISYDNVTDQFLKK